MKFHLNDIPLNIYIKGMLELDAFMQDKVDNCYLSFAVTVCTFHVPLSQNVATTIPPYSGLGLITIPKCECTCICAQTTYPISYYIKIQLSMGIHPSPYLAPNPTPLQVSSWGFWFWNTLSTPNLGMPFVKGGVIVMGDLNHLQTTLSQINQRA